jgi:hypothetical protein
MDICDQTDPWLCGNQIADPLLQQTVLSTAGHHSKEFLHSSVDRMKKPQVEHALLVDLVWRWGHLGLAEDH